MRELTSVVAMTRHLCVQKAELLLRRGLTMEADNAHLLHALALLEYKRENYSEARHLFKRATEVVAQHITHYRQPMYCVPYLQEPCVVDMRTTHGL
jgi:hypothetical protein